MSKTPKSIEGEAKQRMEKSLHSLREELSKLRTGRASPRLVEHIKVSYYGSDTPLSQVASVTVADARTLLVSPWEKNLISEVEKAILNADLGLNPVTGSDSLRIPLPPLTEERRRDLIKVLKQSAESARVSVRNIRRDANQACKQLQKDKEINEDELRLSEGAIQKLTDQFVKEIEKVSAEKETDLLEI